MFRKIKHFIKNWQANRIRHIADEYFKGYRRLAESQEEIDSLGNHCWTCRHSVAFVTWHCDKTSKCNYEQCYIKSKLTRADYYNGNWIGLPLKDN